MGTKLTGAYTPNTKLDLTTKTNSNSSTTGSNYLSGASLLGNSNQTSETASSSNKTTNKTDTSNNKDTNLGIIGRGLAQLIPSVAKGTTHAIDKITDAPTYIQNTIAQKIANKRDDSYAVQQAAAEIAEKYREKAESHVFGDKVQAFENRVDEKQEAIVKDNPDSKLATTVYKGTELAESVGEMLPGLAVTAATAGIGGAIAGAGTAAGAAAGAATSAGASAGSAVASNVISRVAEGVGLSLMFGNVYADSIDQSVAQGYDYDTSANKAFRDALTEVGTELLFGGIAGTGKALITTKGLSKVATSTAAKSVRSKVGDKAAGSLLLSITDGLNKIGQSSIGKFLIGDVAEDGLGGIVGEAAEEMISEIIGPFNERATTNPDAENATLSEVLEAGLGGAIISAIFGGAQLASDRIRNGKSVTQKDIKNTAKTDEESKTTKTEPEVAEPTVETEEADSEAAKRQMEEMYVKWQSNPKETLRMFSALENGGASREFATTVFEKISPDLDANDYTHLQLPRELAVELPTNIEALTDEQAQAVVDEVIPKLANAYKQFAKLQAMEQYADRYNWDETSKGIILSNPELKSASSAYDEGISKVKDIIGPVDLDSITTEQYAQLLEAGVDLPALKAAAAQAKENAKTNAVTEFENAVKNGTADGIYPEEYIKRYKAYTQREDSKRKYNSDEGEFSGYLATTDTDGNTVIKTVNQVSQDRFGAYYDDLTPEQQKEIAREFIQQSKRYLDQLRESVSELNKSITDAGYSGFHVEIASDNLLSAKDKEETGAWWDPNNSTIYFNPYLIGTKNTAYTFFAHECTHKIATDLANYDKSGFARQQFLDSIIKAMELSGYPIEEARRNIRNSYGQSYYEYAKDILTNHKRIDTWPLISIYKEFKEAREAAGESISDEQFIEDVSVAFANARLDGWRSKNYDPADPYSSYNGVAEEELAAKCVEKLFGSSQLMRNLTQVNSASLEELYRAVQNSSIADVKFNQAFAQARLEILKTMADTLKANQTSQTVAKNLATDITSSGPISINSESSTPFEEASARFSNVSGVSDERMRQYEELKAKYGLNGETSIPNKINSHVGTSRTAGKIFDNENTPSQLRGALINDFLDGILGHLIMTDDAALDYVEKQMGKYQTLNEAAESVINQFSDGRMVNKNDIAFGQQLILDLANEITRINELNATATDPTQIQPTDGLVDLTERLVARVCSAGTRAGQNLQAMAMIKKMTPSGRLYYIESMVNQYISEMIDRKGNSRVGGFQFKRGKNGKVLRDVNGDPIPIQVSDELREKMLECKSKEELDAVEDEIITDIAKQIPAYLSDRVVAWRYLAMLGNPRTHIRNIVSNIAMSGLVRVKDTVKGMLEDLFLGNKTSGRTATNKRIDPELKKAYKEFAIEDWDKNGISDEALDGGKVGFQSLINQRRNKFGNGAVGKILNATQNVNSNGVVEGTLLGGLEGEDYWSGKKAYVHAFVKYCAANNLDVEYLRSKTANSNVALAQARSYAVNEAAKATYHDANNLAQHLSQIEKQSGTVGKIIMGGLIPFKKIPGNVMKRGIEYSPIGLFQGAANLIKAARTTEADYRGEYSALNSKDALNLDKATMRFDKDAKRTRAICDAIDQLSAGLTGTGIMMLGATLGFMGLLKGGGSDNDREEYYDQMLGNQEYSITIAGKNYTLDWLTPACMPLFAGVAIADMFEGDMDLSLGDILNGLSQIADPVMNLSVLQGINEAISSYDSGLGKVVLSAAEGYVGQMIPTLAGQIARTIDPTRRSNYAPTDDSNASSKELKTFYNRMKNKIPFASFTNQEYIDMWGRTESRGNSFIGRLFAQAFAPWYEKDINVTEADDLVAQVYQATGDRNVIPTRPESSYQFDNTTYRLSEQEYHDTQDLVGDLSYAGVLTLKQVYGFQNLSAEEQAELIQQAYSFARKVCKSDYAYTHGIEYTEDSSTTRIKEAVVAGMSIGEALYVNYVANSFSADKDESGNSIRGSKKAKVLSFYASLGLTDQQIQAISLYDTEE